MIPGNGKIMIAISMWLPISQTNPHALKSLPMTLAASPNLEGQQQKLVHSFFQRFILLRCVRISDGGAWVAVN